MLAINALYRLPRGELLLQDAPELIEKVCTCAVIHISSGRSSRTLGNRHHIPIVYCRGNMNTPYASKIEMALGLYKCCDAAFPVSSWLGVNFWGLQQLIVLQLYEMSRLMEVLAQRPTGIVHSYICSDQSITPHFMAQI